MVGCVRRKNGIRDAGAVGTKRSGQVVAPPIGSQGFGGGGEFIDAGFKFDVVRHGTVQKIVEQLAGRNVVDPISWRVERMKGCMDDKLMS